MVKRIWQKGKEKILNVLKMFTLKIINVYILIKIHLKHFINSLII